MESEDHPRCSGRGLRSRVVLLKADVPDSWRGSAVALVSAQPLLGPTDANCRILLGTHPGTSLWHLQEAPRPIAVRPGGCRTLYSASFCRLGFQLQFHSSLN